jgi:hypothetical protein
MVNRRIGCTAEGIAAPQVNNAVAETDMLEG